jgi:hyperosmotically inducible protein
MGRKLLILSMLLTVIFGAAACEKEGPAERAGKKIDKTVEKAGEKVDKTMDKAGEKLEDLGDKAKEATKK